MVMRRVVRAPLPAEMGNHDGLAYSLWLPQTPARAGVVVLHGAGSCKESHHDYARVVIAYGLAAIVFDQRGHGESTGPMDGRVLDDAAAMAALLRVRTGEPALPIAVRGSSMGGYLAILAAAHIDAVAVVAVCPASATGLSRAMHSGGLNLDADLSALDAFLAEPAHDLHHVVERLEVPLLLLHAEGDEQVPVEHSRELAARVRNPASRLIAVPGGHHRSVQHDEELQAVSVRFIERAVSA